MKSSKWKWLTIWALVITTVLWFGSLAAYYMWHSEANDLAQLGDSFGGLTSLFNGLAFVGLIATLLTQKEELGLQREQLKEMKAEASRSAAAHEGMVQLMRAQGERDAHAWRTKQIESVAQSAFALIHDVSTIRNSLATGELALSEISTRNNAPTAVATINLSASFLPQIRPSVYRLVGSVQEYRSLLDGPWGSLRGREAHDKAMVCTGEILEAARCLCAEIQMLALASPSDSTTQTTA